MKKQQKRSGKPQRRPKKDDGLVRLNKYLAQAGICSRREADTYIEAGVVKVNGQVVTTLGTKIKTTDKVTFGDKPVRQEQLEYYLLNKPKDYITTVKDTHNRKTVMDIMDGVSKVRLYPVGRLDRNTSGVLLLTNDGELTKKLTHPKHMVEKIYKAVLDKNLTKQDMLQLVRGVQLDDGVARADEASYVEGASKNTVGLKLHSGKNRVVRRMFEALGYKVIKLDRTVFAGLTKKNLPRGKWRKLTEREVGRLKSL